MGIMSGLVLYAVIWFVVLFVVLPIGLRTQGDEDEIVKGTQAGAPANFRIKRTMVIVSLVAFACWAVVATIILTGAITVRDFDWRGTMGS